MQPVQDLTIEDRVSRTQYQFTLEDRRHRRTGRHGCRSWSTSLQPLPQLRRCGQRPAEPGLAGLCRHRPRHRQPSGHHSRGHRQALYDAFGQRLISTIFTAGQPVPRGARSAAASSSTGRRRSTTSTCPCKQSRADGRSTTDAPGAATRVSRHAGTAVVGGHASRSEHAAGDQPPRPVSGDDDLVQPGPGASLGDAVEPIKQGGGRLGMPRSVHDQFPGRGAGVPGVAHQHAAADPCRHRHHVHRAGRALRELHPSDHDSVDVAVGGHRRAAGADGRRQRPRHHRASSASFC